MPLLYPEIKGNCTRNPSYSSSNFPAGFCQLGLCNSLVECSCLIKPKKPGCVIVPERNISLKKVYNSFQYSYIASSLAAK